MEKEAEEVAKEWQALFESKNIHDEFNVWLAIWHQICLSLFLPYGRRVRPIIINKVKRILSEGKNSTWRYRRNQWVFAENLR